MITGAVALRSLGTAVLRKSRCTIAYHDTIASGATTIRPSDIVIAAPKNRWGLVGRNGRVCM